MYKSNVSSRIVCTTHTVQGEVKAVVTDAFLPRVTLQHQSAAAPRDPPRQSRGSSKLQVGRSLRHNRGMTSDFWAGYISGALGIIIGNPLDVVKVRLQAGSLSDASSRPHLNRIERVSSLVRGLCIDLLCSV